MELLITVMVIGILTTIGLVNYGIFKERTLNKEAESDLRLIMAAEKIFHMENNQYLASDSNQDINNSFKLMLPTSADTKYRPWDYATFAPDADHCCAQATRTAGSDIRSWHLDYDEDEVLVGGCS